MTEHPCAAWSGWRTGLPPLERWRNWSRLCSCGEWNTGCNWIRIGRRKNCRAPRTPHAARSGAGFCRQRKRLPGATESLLYVGSWSISWIVRSSAPKPPAATGYQPLPGKPPDNIEARWMIGKVFPRIPSPVTRLSQALARPFIARSRHYWGRTNFFRKAIGSRGQRSWCVWTLFQPGSGAPALIKLLSTAEVWLPNVHRSLKAIWLRIC